METKELKFKIKKLLSEFLGVEVGDINDDDDFIHDLQMEPASLFDFQEKLKSEGVTSIDIDFKEVVNINELLDALDGASSTTDSEELN